jgi:hypothetical protein
MATPNKSKWWLTLKEINVGMDYNFVSINKKSEELSATSGSLLELNHPRATIFFLNVFASLNWKAVFIAQISKAPRQLKKISSIYHYVLCDFTQAIYVYFYSTC